MHLDLNYQWENDDSDFGQNHAALMEKLDIIPAHEYI